ncbi:RluA family pseudouridine synthase [Candidatus Saccharibacteria bacterium]|nr:RluA family pseudouridine synthase [Candidatus Saccharibacteria bacterium]
MRLDSFLVEKYPEHSRSVWRRYIEAGYVKVNGRVVARTELAKDSDKIEIDIPESTKQPLDLPVLYEDENVVVIDKPAGVLTHSKGALNDEFTVADFIRTKSVGTDSREAREDGERGSDESCDDRHEERSREFRSEDFTGNRFGIVHRLDRATSGVIIGAKTDEARKFLQKQFAERKAKKTYLAIVENPPLKPAARIDLPIARDPKRPSRFRVDPKGKPAITDYRVLQILRDGRALVELKPLTGRTHQLRVHMAHIGAPIVGDPIYGAAGTVPAKSGATGLQERFLQRKREERMLLHAACLEITIPGGERKTFRAELPKDFR